MLPLATGLGIGKLLGLQRGLSHIFCIYQRLCPWHAYRACFPGVQEYFSLLQREIRFHDNETNILWVGA